MSSWAFTQQFEFFVSSYKLPPLFGIYVLNACSRQILDFLFLGCRLLLLVLKIKRQRVVLNLSWSSYFKLLRLLAQLQWSKLSVLIWILTRIYVSQVVVQGQWCTVGVLQCLYQSLYFWLSVLKTLVSSNYTWSISHRVTWIRFMGLIIFGRHHESTGIVWT